jgi:poly(beta-D-mannuronate) lyase
VRSLESWVYAFDVNIPIPHRPVLLFCALLLLCGSQLYARAEALRSPWGAVTINSSAPIRACDPAPKLPRSLAFNGYYADEHHSVIDPQAKAAYEAASKANELFVKRVGRSADGYQADHSESAAQCALSLLYQAAEEKAFTIAQLGKGGARDGFYVQAFYLDGLSLAYLKVSNSPFVRSQQRSAIQAWLIQIADSVREFFDDMARQNAGDGHNNLTYWGALAVSATGIATDRHDLFGWGIGKYRLGIRQILDDGTLPLEMDRAAMALHYHLFAVAPLVLLAELGEVNGLDLYSEDDGALHRLVQRTASGLKDPVYFQQKTGFAQEIPKELDGSVVGWVVPFEARFPSPTIASLLAAASSTSNWQMGGLTPK